MEYFVGWVACILIGVLIGRTRGRGEFGGLVSALLGRLGWLIVLLCGDSRAKCPACFSAIPDKRATRCRSCGAEFVAPVESEHIAWAANKKAQHEADVAAM